ncbi:MAG: hypothetical protein ACPGVG_11820 [Mycobacterium sp.]
MTTGTETEQLIDHGPDDIDALAAILDEPEDVGQAEGEAADPAAEGEHEGAIASDAADAGSAEAESVAAEEKAATPPADTWESLRALATERRQARSAAPEDKPAAPEGPTAADLLRQMNERDEYRAAVEEAKAGKLTRLAKITGKDPATLFEQFSREGLKPGSVSAEQRVAQLEAELAEIKNGSASSVEKLREEIAERAAAENQQREVARFQTLTSTAESFPLLSRLAPETRLQYGEEAAQLLIAAGRDPDVEVAAQLAERKLEQLAQQLTGAGQQNVAGSEKSAGENANPRGTRPTGIDNRTASTIAAIDPPTLEDDEAFIERMSAP